MMTITVNGRSIEQFTKDVETKVNGFKNEFANEFTERVQVKTPVRSGTLKNGWQQTMTNAGYELHNYVEYATYVEFGTTKMQPTGMVATTALEAQDITELAVKRTMR